MGYAALQARGSSGAAGTEGAHHWQTGNHQGGSLVPPYTADNLKSRTRVHGS